MFLDDDIALFQLTALTFRFVDRDMFMRYFPGGGVGHAYVSVEQDESNDTATPMDIDDVPDFAIHHDIQPGYVPPEFDEGSDGHESEENGEDDSEDEELFDDEANEISGPGANDEGSDDLGADDGEGSDMDDTGYGTA